MKPYFFVLSTVLFSGVFSGCVSNLPAKYEVSKAAQAFRLRCAGAGEKIKRTVENVNEIYVMRLRSGIINFDDQYRLDDPYGSDSLGDGYLKTFIRKFHEEARSASSASKRPDAAAQEIGYYSVVAVDALDEKNKRYTGRIEEPWIDNKKYLKGYRRVVMDAAPLDGLLPAYGVIYEDISTKDDRDLWIAGSSLRVIDLRTNEVIGERVGYMFDPAQGSRAGGRAPWLMAANYACPSFGHEHAFSNQSGQTVRFVQKILHPTTGN